MPRVGFGSLDFDMRRGSRISFISKVAAAAPPTGKNLISCDSGSASIYIHSGITSTITTSFSSPKPSPRGLAYDGANLISSDTLSFSIYIHSGVTKTITTSFSSPGGQPQGLEVY